MTAVGFLLAGPAVLRAGAWHGWRRYVPLAMGVWTALLLGVSFTKALPLGVAIYGAFILLLGLALYPAPAGTRTPATSVHCGVNVTSELRGPAAVIDDQVTEPGRKKSNKSGGPLTPLRPLQPCRLPSF